MASKQYKIIINNRNYVAKVRGLYYFLKLIGVDEEFERKN
jgi:hypothetical protein